MIIKTPKFFLIIILILVSVAVGGAVGYFAYLIKREPSQAPSEAPAQVSVQPSTITTINGEIVCLPRRNKTGSQTFECSIGLYGIDGYYYGLANLNEQEVLGGKVAVGQKVEVSGTLQSVPLDDYDVRGVIEVKTIRLVEK